MKKVRLRSRLILCVAFLFAAICGYTQDSLLVDTSEVYFIVDEMPKFEGGNFFESEFRHFLMTNFTYPEELIEEYGIVCTFRIDFIVSKEGKLVNGKMTARGVDSKEINQLFQQEFNRITKLLPKITPGKQKGEYVNVKYTIPLSVNLQ